jgi:hypothetical protein
VYCASASCRNSTLPQGAWGVLGYRNDYVYQGSKLDWQEAGLPVERGASGPCA